MKKMIHLTRDQRGVVVRTFFGTYDALTQRRAQSLLMLDDEHPFDYVVATVGAEAAEVMETICLFRDSGLAFITG